ncbi:MAG: hypothetical protein ACRD18_15840 [Terriglobia bacterium]
MTQRDQYSVMISALVIGGRSIKVFEQQTGLNNEVPNFIVRVVTRLKVVMSMNGSVPGILYPFACRHSAFVENPFGFRLIQPGKYL